MVRLAGKDFPTCLDQPGFMKLLSEPRVGVHSVPVDAAPY